MSTKEELELRFGKGPEHEEINDLFAAFAFELDRRLPDSVQKDQMLVYLDQAAVRAHDAVRASYPSDNDLAPLSPPAQKPLADDKVVHWEQIPEEFRKRFETTGKFDPLPRRIPKSKDFDWTAPIATTFKDMPTETETPSDGG